MALVYQHLGHGQGIGRQRQPDRAEGRGRGRADRLPGKRLRQRHHGADELRDHRRERAVAPGQDAPRLGQPALPGEQVVAIDRHPGQAEAVEIGIPVIQPERHGQTGGDRAQPRERRPVRGRIRGRPTRRAGMRTSETEELTRPPRSSRQARPHSHSARAPGRAVPRAGNVTAPCRNGMSRSKGCSARNAAAQAMTASWPRSVPSGDALSRPRATRSGGSGSGRPSCRPEEGREARGRAASHAPARRLAGGTRGQAWPRARRRRIARPRASARPGEADAG